MIDTEDMRREGKEASGLRCGEYCVKAADEIERLIHDNAQLIKAANAEAGEVERLLRMKMDSMQKRVLVFIAGVVIGSFLTIALAATLHLH